MLPARKEYLSSGEVARNLGITVRTLQQWIRDGRIPAPPRNSKGHFEWTSADLGDLRSLPRIRPGRVKGSTKARSHAA